MATRRGDDDLIGFELDDVQRRVLRCGLVEWGGPARCTDALAVAMGFDGVADLLADTDRLVDAIDGSQPLSRLDWFRVVLATEIAFVSDAVGSGWDWSVTTGLSDAETLAALRAIQQTTTPTLRGLG